MKMSIRNIFRQYLMTLILSAFAPIAFAQQVDSAISLNLQRCVEIAFKNNPDLNETELQSRSSKLNLDQSKNELLPQINGSVDHGLNQGRSIDPFTNGYLNQNINYANWGLTGGINIFNGLAAQYSIKQQSLLYLASKKEVQQKKDELSIKIIIAYLQILNAEDQLALIGEQAALTQMQVERLTLLNKEGTINPSQLYDLKGQLSGDEINLVNTRNQLEAAKISLAQLLNLPYQKEIKLERISPDQFLQQYEGEAATIYQAALQQLAQVKAVSLRREGAEWNVKTLKARLWPVVSLNGGVFTNYSSAAFSSTLLRTSEEASGDYVYVNGNKSPVYTNINEFSQQKIPYGNQFKNNYNFNLNLALRIPILNSFRSRNQIAQAKIDLQKASFIEESTRIALQQSIEQAYINMKASYEKHMVLRNQVAAYEESFRITEARFNAGVLNSVDYLVAKNNLDKARLNLIANQYEYVFRTRILDYYQAKPLW